jgi:predicted permease
MTTNLRYALRQLAKSPGFTLVAILALALGIGANVAIFSVVNSVLLRPLPYPEPDRIVRLASTVPDSAAFTRVGFSYPRYLAVKGQQQVFSDLAFSVFNAFTLTGRGDPVQIVGFHATANYLGVLGVQPLFGRTFTAAEDQPGGEPVVMISHAFWQRQFNGDRGALGQVLTLNGTPHTIVGVLPPALSAFPLNQVEVWVPRPAEVPYLVPSQLEGGGYFFQVLARLKPGVTLAQAQENMNVIAASYRNESTKRVDAPSNIELVPILEDTVGNQRRTYLLIFSAVACVLLIACANVANLLLARFAGRRKEIAVRFALGARRAQVVRQLVLESLLVACAGGAAGILLATWSVSALVAAGADLIPRAAEISIDPTVVAFTVGLSLLTGLAMGLIPAFQAATHDVSDALKESARGSSAADHRLRSGLLVAEIALSLVLLIAAGLLLTSFARLQRVSPGFTPQGIFVGGVNIASGQYRDPQKLVAFYRQLYERLGAIPGVKSAALGDRVPLTGNTSPAPVAVAGRALLPIRERAMANRHLVTPNYFATLGIRLLAGRDFSERDTPSSPHVVIINEAFAKQHFPNENPLGRTLITGMGQIPSEIVGIVSDIRATNLNTPPAPDYYLPALQRPEQFTSILLRTEGDPAGLTSAVRAALSSVDPNLPLQNPQTLTVLIEQNVADRRLVMSLLAGFAALALVLASIGVYSVMAYVVSQRTAEIGIRMALGASPGDVQTMVLGQGMRLALLGVTLGLGAALAVTRLMQQALFEVQPHDPMIYGGVALIIFAVAALACWLPARRATKVDPLVALRAS